MNLGDVVGVIAADVSGWVNNLGVAESATKQFSATSVTEAAKAARAFEDYIPSVQKAAEAVKKSSAEIKQAMMEEISDALPLNEAFANLTEAKINYASVSAAFVQTERSGSEAMVNQATSAEDLLAAYQQLQSASTALRESLALNAVENGLEAETAKEATTSINGEYAALEKLSSVLTTNAQSSLSSSTSLRGLGSAAKEGEQGLSSFNSSVQSSGMFLSQFGGPVGQAAGQVSMFSSSLLRLGPALLTPVGAAVALAVATAAFTAAIEVQAIKLQNAQAQLAAWGGMNTEQANAISTSWGKTSDTFTFTNAQITGSFAKISAQIPLITGQMATQADASQVMGSSMTLAAASGESLDSTSHALVSTLTAFNLTLNESGRATTILFEGSRLAGESVQQFGSQMDMVREQTGSLNLSLEQIAEVTVSVQAAGSAGQMGLRFLAESMNSISASSPDLLNALRNANLASSDLTSTNMDASKVLNTLITNWSGLTEAQKLAIEQAIGGQRQYGAVASILNEMARSHDVVTQRLHDQEAATRAASLQTGTLTGELGRAKAATENWASSIGSNLNSKLGDFFSGLWKATAATIAFKEAQMAASNGDPNAGAMLKKAQEDLANAFKKTNDTVAESKNYYASETTAYAETQGASDKLNASLQMGVDTRRLLDEANKAEIEGNDLLGGQLRQLADLSEKVTGSTLKATLQNKAMGDVAKAERDDINGNTEAAQLWTLAVEAMINKDDTAAAGFERSARSSEENSKAQVAGAREAGSAMMSADAIQTKMVDDQQRASALMAQGKSNEAAAYTQAASLEGQALALVQGIDSSTSAIELENIKVKVKNLQDLAAQAISSGTSQQEVSAAVTKSNDEAAKAAKVASDNTQSANDAITRSQQSLADIEDKVNKANVDSTNNKNKLILQSDVDAAHSQVGTARDAMNEENTVYQQSLANYQALLSLKASSGSDVYDNQIKAAETETNADHDELSKQVKNVDEAQKQETQIVNEQATQRKSIEAEVTSADKALQSAKTDFFKMTNADIASGARAVSDDQIQQDIKSASSAQATAITRTMAYNQALAEESQAAHQLKDAFGTADQESAQSALTAAQQRVTATKDAMNQSVTASTQATQQMNQNEKARSEYEQDLLKFDVSAKIDAEKQKLQAAVDRINQERASSDYEMQTTIMVEQVKLQQYQNEGNAAQASAQQEIISAQKAAQVKLDIIKNNEAASIASLQGPLQKLQDDADQQKLIYEGAMADIQVQVAKIQVITAQIQLAGISEVDKARRDSAATQVQLTNEANTTVIKSEDTKNRFLIAGSNDVVSTAADNSQAASSADATSDQTILSNNQAMYAGLVQMQDAYYGITDDKRAANTAGDLNAALQKINSDNAAATNAIDSLKREDPAIADLNRQTSAFQQDATDKEKQVNDELTRTVDLINAATQATSKGTSAGTSGSASTGITSSMAAATTAATSLAAATTTAAAATTFLTSAQTAEQTANTVLIDQADLQIAKLNVLKVRIDDQTQALTNQQQKIKDSIQIEKDQNDIIMESIDLLQRQTDILNGTLNAQNAQATLTRDTNLAPLQSKADQIQLQIDEIDSQTNATTGLTSAQAANLASLTNQKNAIDAQIKIINDQYNITNDSTSAVKLQKEAIDNEIQSMNDAAKVRNDDLTIQGHEITNLQLQVDLSKQQSDAIKKEQDDLKTQADSYTALNDVLDKTNKLLTDEIALLKAAAQATAEGASANTIAANNFTTAANNAITSGTAAGSAAVAGQYTSVNGNPSPAQVAALPASQPSTIIGAPSSGSGGSGTSGGSGVSASILAATGQAKVASTASDASTSLQSFTTVLQSVTQALGTFSSSLNETASPSAPSSPTSLVGTTTEGSNPRETQQYGAYGLPLATGAKSEQALNAVGGGFGLVAPQDRPFWFQMGYGSEQAYQAANPNPYNTTVTAGSGAQVNPLSQPQGTYYSGGIPQSSPSGGQVTVNANLNVDGKTIATATGNALADQANLRLSPIQGGGA